MPLDVRADVATILDEPPESLDEDEDLFERGLDSVRLMSLMETWRASGREVALHDLAEEPTLAAWGRLLEA